MTFTTPLALLLLLLLPALAYVGWPRLAYRRRRDTISLLLRLLIVLLLVLGLAGMQVSQAAEKLAVVFLVDASDSMDAAAQGAALDYVRAAMATSGPNDQTAVILFGGNALVERPMQPGTELGQIGSQPVTLNTDLAEAIRLGTALFPTDTAKRMVILSDGVETVGDAAEAARLAAASGIQINFVPFQRQPAPEILVTDVQVPTRLTVDEPFEINYTVESEIDTEAVASLLASGQTLARTRLQLRQGENRYFFRLPNGFPATGFSDIRIQVEPVDATADGFYQNNRLSAFTEITGPSRVLLVHPEGEEGEQEIVHLLPALEEVGLGIDVVTPDELPIGLAPLSAYVSVILADVPAAELSPLRMEVLRTYVRDLGGGLVVLGGPHSYGVGGYFRTPLEDTLPVEMQLRDQERLPSLTLLFVIDSSGSMAVVGPSGYSNLDLAKEAVIRSVDLLAPTDTLGVVSFDSAASWIIQPVPVENPPALQEQIARLRPGGGTDILAGLRAGADYLAQASTPLSHIILLTDGGANPAGIQALVERMRVEYGTTTSVVAIGDGFAPFLQDVAVTGGGNFHFARDVSTIPSIFTAETVLATRTYIVEENFYPAQVGDSPILTGIMRVPQLHGYVATTAKDTAQVLMRSPEPNADPILAVWQFGLGRAVAWTSDATSRWASEWVIWEDYPRFFSQMVRWTITEGINSSLEARVEQRGEEAVLVVDARDREGAFLNGLLLNTAIVSPDLETQTVQLYQVAPGRYEGVFEPGAEGAYFIRAAGQPIPGAPLPVETLVAQTTGWVLTYSPEYRLPESGVNLTLLNDLANLTGGDALVDRPNAVYTHDLPAAGAATPLWPGLFLAATLLLPFDVGVRRLIVTMSDLRRLRAWLLPRLGIQPPVVDETRLGQIDRLRGARQRAREDLDATYGSSAAGSGAPYGSVPSPVDRILPADERQQATPAAPAEERPVGPEGAMAAALAARKRARAAEVSATPPAPLPLETTPPEPPRDHPAAQPPAEPAAHPARPATAVPKLQAKPVVEEEKANLASRLLKRRKDE